MFIKKLDYISPPVTFYHQGLLSHTSIFSGILSIISIIFIICLGIYYFFDIIFKEDPKTTSYSNFIQDAGVFSMNSTSLFHFISMMPLETNYENDGVDFTTFRIVGFENYYEAYIFNKNLSNFDHWLYGKCNKQTNVEGIANLVDN